MSTGANDVFALSVETGDIIWQYSAEVGKTGWAYILDRVTGEPIVGIVEPSIWGGGLIVVGRNDGRLTALDSATGKEFGRSKPLPA